MSSVSLDKANRWKGMFSSLNTEGATTYASAAPGGSERPIRRVVIPSEAKPSELPAFHESDIADIHETDQVGRIEEENPTKPTVSIAKSREDVFIDFNPPGALPGSPFHASVPDAAASEPVVGRRPRPKASVDLEAKKSPENSSAPIATSLLNKRKSRFYTASSQGSVSSASQPSAPVATRRRSRELLPSAFAHATKKQQTKMRPQVKAHASGPGKVVLQSTLGDKQEMGSTRAGFAELDRRNLRVQLNEVLDELRIIKTDGAGSPGRHPSPKQQLLSPQVCRPCAHAHDSPSRSAAVPVTISKVSKVVPPSTAGRRQFLSPMSHPAPARRRSSAGPEWRPAQGERVSVMMPDQWNGWLRHTHGERPFVTAQQPAVNHLPDAPVRLAREAVTSSGRQLRRSLSCMSPRAYDDMLQTISGDDAHSKSVARKLGRRGVQQLQGVPASPTGSVGKLRSPPGSSRRAKPDSSSLTSPQYDPSQAPTVLGSPLPEYNPYLPSFPPQYVTGSPVYNPAQYYVDVPSSVAREAMAAAWLVPQQAPGEYPYYQSFDPQQSYLQQSLPAMYDVPVDPALQYYNQQMASSAAQVPPLPQLQYEQPYQEPQQQPQSQYEQQYQAQQQQPQLQYEQQYQAQQQVQQQYEQQYQPQQGIPLQPQPRRRHSEVSIDYSREYATPEPLHDDHGDDDTWATSALKDALNDCSTSSSDSGTWRRKQASTCTDATSSVHTRSEFDDSTFSLPVSNADRSTTDGAHHSRAHANDSPSASTRTEDVTTISRSTAMDLMRELEGLDASSFSNSSDEFSDASTVSRTARPPKVSSRSNRRSRHSAAQPSVSNTSSYHSSISSLRASTETSASSQQKHSLRRTQVPRHVKSSRTQRRRLQRSKRELSAIREDILVSSEDDHKQELEARLIQSYRAQRVGRSPRRGDDTTKTYSPRRSPRHRSQHGTTVSSSSESDVHNMLLSGRYGQSSHWRRQTRGQPSLTVVSSPRHTASLSPRRTQISDSVHQIQERVLQSNRDQVLQGLRGRSASPRHGTASGDGSVDLLNRVFLPNELKAALSSHRSSRFSKSRSRSHSPRHTFASSMSDSTEQFGMPEDALRLSPRLSSLPVGDSRTSHSSRSGHATSTSSSHDERHRRSLTRQQHSLRGDAQRQSLVKRFAPSVSTLSVELSATSEQVRRSHSLQRSPSSGKSSRHHVSTASTSNASGSDDMFIDDLSAAVPAQQPSMPAIPESRKKSLIQRFTSNTTSATEGNTASQSESSRKHARRTRKVSDASTKRTSKRSNDTELRERRLRQKQSSESSAVSARQRVIDAEIEKEREARRLKERRLTEERERERSRRKK